MIIPPKFEFTKEIALLLGQLEANRVIIDSLSVPEAIERNFRRSSILGSSLFSARIEGNTLLESDISDFRDLTSQEKNKIEVANLVRVFEYLLEHHKTPRPITKDEILHWHQMAMENILAGEYLGVFRTGHEGVFDVAGNLIYHAPPPAQVNGLIDQLLAYANQKDNESPPIQAIFSHLVFEKIHPFVDGSGLVGRLLQSAILSNFGYAMKGLVVVEREIDTQKQHYYRAIESNDPTQFLQLMLELLVTASEKAKDKILGAQKYQKEDSLAPRRREILEIVRDHQMVSFDFLHRRFMNINPRLLAYDLKFLIDHGHINKIGKTRGALYSPKP